MSATVTDRRVSARRCIPLEQVEGAKFDLLCLVLPDLQHQVRGVTVGLPVKAENVYLTFETVVGTSEPAGGDAA